ncbi:hypothetical protein [Bifidobacterium scardovii]|uniref:Phage P1-related protein n=1 Tax=Bifidobacterium scardovii TaxID=158787 RepID=A0A087DI72_9BIFI|nr:hypothetical protein [Bifidobacterium scardovii]KFI95222.1 phage P1-related protein [Bifidobacterium scardovii]MDK6348696.1 hypothetical protein [Bifidobacterium scardovii]MDU8981326.1 hypothetical protein [Bifidobacterium scardovii]
MSNPHWLPHTIPWNQTQGETWEQYEQRLFHVFQAEFGNQNPLLFQGEPVRFRRIPYTGIYPEAFVHLTTCKQDDSDTRLPDPLRSERIGWPRPIMENYPSCDICNYEDCVKPWVWINDKKVKIYLPNQQYLVILSQRGNQDEGNGYWVLITAYHLEQSHRIARIEKEYDSRFSTKVQ